MVIRTESLQAAAPGGPKCGEQAALLHMLAPDLDLDGFDFQTTHGASLAFFAQSNALAQSCVGGPPASFGIPRAVDPTSIVPSTVTPTGCLPGLPVVFSSAGATAACAFASAAR